MSTQLSEQKNIAKVKVKKDGETVSELIRVENMGLGDCGLYAIATALVTLTREKPNLAEKIPPLFYTNSDQQAAFKQKIKDFRLTSGGFDSSIGGAVKRFAQRNIPGFKPFIGQAEDDLLKEAATLLRNKYKLAVLTSLQKSFLQGSPHTYENPFINSKLISLFEYYDPKVDAASFPLDALEVLGETRFLHDREELRKNFKPAEDKTRRPTYSDASKHFVMDFLGNELIVHLMKAKNETELLAALEFSPNLEKLIQQKEKLKNTGEANSSWLRPEDVYVLIEYLGFRPCIYIWSSRQFEAECDKLDPKKFHDLVVYFENGHFVSLTEDSTLFAQSTPSVKIKIETASNTPDQGTQSKARSERAKPSALSQGTTSSLATPLIEMGHFASARSTAAHSTQAETVSDSPAADSSPLYILD